MAFPKTHGLQIAGGGYIKNAMIESLATDPSVSVEGRIWYSNIAKRWKMSTNVAGSVVIRAFATFEEFDAFMTAVAAQTPGASGTTLIGYDGKSGPLNVFSVSAGTVKTVLDNMIVQIDASAKAINDIGSGNLVNMQTEIDKIETALGFNADGSFKAFTGSNYLDAATTVDGALSILDGQISTANTTYTNLTNNIQAELDRVETASGLNSDGTFTAATGTNYIGAATSLKGADVLLDTQIKATDVIAQAALARTGGTMTGSIGMGGFAITGVADPTADQDAATKAYVDATAQGLIVKDAARVATTANLPALSGLLTIDGVELVAGNRVLVKDQTTASQNGIYIAASGAWTRSLDLDGTPASETKAGCFTFVQEGTKNASNGYVITTAGAITVGTTGIAWAQFSGAGQILPGVGLAKEGNTMSVMLGGGIGELPTGEVGVDVYGSGGLWTTLDGTSSSTDTAAQVGIKLDGTTLSLSPAGLKASDATIATITAAQAEVDRVELAIGLNADGTFTAPAGTNYLGSTTSVFNALTTLDSQAKTNATDVASVQAETNAVETAVGLAADGTFVAWSGTNYLNSATSIKTGITALDTAVKTNSSGIDSLKSAINATVYKMQSSTAATSFTVAHNLGTQFVEVTVFVQDDDLLWKHDLVGITISNDNSLVVDLTESRQIRVIVRSAESLI